MKKWLPAVLTLMTATVVSMASTAGAFEQYYDYKNEDGTYSYYFTEGLTVTMSEEWYQKTRVTIDEGGATFRHRDSYNQYAKEGLDGGKLFTIKASVNTDFQELPSYEFLGFDEESCMNYFVIFPTDFQGYADDPAVSAEYQSLWDGVEEVVAGIQIPGSGQEEAEFPAPAPALSGGWSVTTDAAVTEEARAALETALQKMTGVAYEPVALLATQVVAGTNYCLLCRMTVTNPDAVPAYGLVYVYADLQGGAEIIGINELTFGTDGLEVPAE